MQATVGHSTPRVSSQGTQFCTVISEWETFTISYERQVHKFLLKSLPICTCKARAEPEDLSSTSSSKKRAAPKVVDLFLFPSSINNSPNAEYYTPPSTKPASVQ